jgi:hypothetical protein
VLLTNGRSRSSEHLDVKRKGHPRSHPRQRQSSRSSFTGGMTPRLPSASPSQAWRAMPGGAPRMGQGSGAARARAGGYSTSSAARGATAPRRCSWSRSSCSSGWPRWCRRRRLRMKLTYQRRQPEHTVLGEEPANEFPADSIPAGAPHEPQNRLPGARSPPHCAQVSVSRLPQSSQNRSPSRFSAWHRGHVMAVGARLRPDRSHPFRQTERAA